MDAGWKSTYDVYFKKVQKIFKSVFAQLPRDHRYTYTLGDIAFFRRYYIDVATQQERDSIKRLV